MSNEGQRAAVALERLRSLASNQEHRDAVDVLDNYIQQGSATELYAELVGSISTALGDQGTLISENSSEIVRLRETVLGLSTKVATLNTNLVDKSNEKRKGWVAKLVTDVVLSLSPAWRGVVAVVLAIGLVVALSTILDGGFGLIGIKTNATESVGELLDQVPAIGPGE